MSDSALWSAERIARLISAAQSGSTDSLNALLVAVRPGLVTFFSRRLARDQAEDLTQAALIRIVRALPSIEPVRGDRFISTVAVNLLRTAFAQRARDRSRWAPVNLAKVFSTQTALDLHVEYEELTRAVHRACSVSLPPALQEVVLGVLRGETPTEIAKRLQLNPTTVRTRLVRARKILQLELAPYLDVSGAEEVIGEIGESSPRKRSSRIGSD